MDTLTAAATAKADLPETRAIELSIVMPCLDEAETLAVCVEKANQFFRDSGVAGEVIIADNGSTDGSQAIAAALGARVINVPRRGYGAAIAAGIEAAHGTFVAMGDSDDSYDFLGLLPFVVKLRAGADLVMGNRFQGGIAKGAMPPLHRYLGNPVLSGIGRLFYNIEIGDFHCGLRAFRRDAVLGLKLKTSGMEFASEMVVKAQLTGLKIAEVPTTLSPDGRSRAPHLRSWRDGWRHLRFLLLHTPRWLFLYPGLALITIGLSLMILLVRGPLHIGAISFDVNSLLYAGFCFTVGVQVMIFSVLTKYFGARAGLLPRDERFELIMGNVTLEMGLLLGGLLVACGIVGSAFALHLWTLSSFQQLDFSIASRLTIPSVTLLASGTEIIFASFFFHIVRIGVGSKSR